jgi:hypothetical protein
VTRSMPEIIQNTGCCGIRKALAMQPGGCYDALLVLSLSFRPTWTSVFAPSPIHVFNAAAVALCSASTSIGADSSPFDL